MGLRRSHSASGSAGLTIQSPADTSDRRGGGVGGWWNDGVRGWGGRTVSWQLSASLTHRQITLKGCRCGGVIKSGGGSDK